MAAPTPTTLSTIEDRARAVGLNLSQVARKADVNARHLWESRLSDGEVERVEAVLIAHESALVEDGR